MHRNYPPAQASQQRSPQARRGPGGPMPAPQQVHPQHQQLTPQQQHAAHLEQQRRQEMFRRQARKPTDREIPDDVADVIVGDGVERYRKLRDVERRLDAVMTRKRLDISDNVQRRYARREGVLRIAISNTAEGQPWQVVEEGNGHEDGGMFELGENQATYRVKIEGRLLDDPSEEESEATAPAQRPRLSHFFKAITIDFDRDPNLQADGYSQIEWRKANGRDKGPALDANSSELNFDTLEFERKADENMDVTINLVRDERFERAKLSPALAALLDTDEDDKVGVVQGVWDYCRANGLQEDDDKRKIVCDEPLRRVFGQDSLYFPYVPDLLSQHMEPLPPIKLPYTIRVDKPYITGVGDEDAAATASGPRPSRPTVYDIRVQLPNPLEQELLRMQSSKAHLADLQNIVRIDDDLALLVQKMHATNAKRKFYDRLATDPAAFVQRWVSSQQRDLEVIMAEATRAGIAGSEDLPGATENMRKGGADGVWGSDLARESVALWLARGGKAH